jgi:hypothetical protein
MNPIDEQTIKDAKRYQWLREQHWWDNKIAVVLRPKESIGLGYYCPSEDSLDDFIDEAMK